MPINLSALQRELKARTMGRNMRMFKNLESCQLSSDTGYCQALYFSFVRSQLEAVHIISMLDTERLRSLQKVTPRERAAPWSSTALLGIPPDVFPITHTLALPPRATRNGIVSF